MSPNTHANLSQITVAAKARRKAGILARRQQRADALFGMYWQLGSDRSLALLKKQCDGLGIKTSDTSLGNYSSRYHWQERLLEMAVKERELVEQDAIRQVHEMNTEHAKTFRALFGLGKAGMQKHIQELRDKQMQGKSLTLSMDWPDIMAALSTAQRGERLARGQATSRLEIMVDVLNTVVQEFALVFTSVPGVTEEMKEYFAAASDSMLKRYLSQQVPQLKGEE